MKARVSCLADQSLRNLRISCLASMLITALYWPAAAAGDTLAKIAETKTISIGHREDAVPFSYRGPDGTVIGYSTELCVQISHKIRTKLGLDSLRINFVPSTAATRFVLIKSGKIDLECTTTTNTAERRGEVGFTYPHFVTATRFVSKKRDALGEIPDLAGRSVVSTTGTVNIEQLQALNRKESLNISVMLAKTHKEAFAMVESDRASAFVMDGILLAALVASSSEPDAYVISQQTLGPPEPYGILVPKDDDAFRQAVNGALSEIFISGEINAIYNKWFMSPIPPDGRNLNLPLSPQLKAAFDNPEDYVR